MHTLPGPFEMCLHYNLFSVCPCVTQAIRRQNPAADPRTMRRVIAEDPNWNLETVLPLVDACIKHIVNNFHGRTHVVSE